MMPLEYETLKFVWWVLLGVLLIGFALTDGFDLGVGALLPFVARDDNERRSVINTIGPVWEGNQVWLVLGAGAIFAAWPAVYAMAFSGFYIAMFMALAALIIRPVSFTFRSKSPGLRWRRFWDGALCVSGIVPAIIFGVAVGNVLQGVPFHLDEFHLPVYEGSFLGLLNPFALVCGVIALGMFIVHGASWLAVKTTGAISQRSRNIGFAAALITTVLFALAGVWTAFGLNGYVITSGADPNGPANPLAKQAAIQAGAWLNNYNVHWQIMAAPATGIGAMLLTALMIRGRGEKRLLIMSGLAIAGIIATVGVSMFPFIIPSSSDPRSSLTVWDASSSHLTLFIMAVAAVIFIPVIILYTGFVYRTLRGKVDIKELLASKESY